MKANISRHFLESALSRCYDATERKAEESFTKFEFTKEGLKLSTKGGVTFYEELISFISCDKDFTFCTKTTTVLEWVKYISTEDLSLTLNEDLKTFVLVSGSNKSKMKIQVASVIIEKNQESDIVTSFKVTTAADLISKLNFASKFCSVLKPGENVSSIHCEVSQDSLSIKATSGATLYMTSIEIEAQNPAKIYIPKKSAGIIKNVYHDIIIEKCTIFNRSMQFESEFGKLTVYLESFQDNEFPGQIVEWTKKDSQAKVKASIFEISKTLKFFNLMYDNTALDVSDGKLALVADLDNTKDKEKDKEDKKDVENKTIVTRAKSVEQILVEECTGEASSAYPVKSFIDCLEALSAIWVNLEFVQMVTDDLFICKMTHGNTVILLCPLI